MAYIAFVDESGDHGLDTIDPQSPIFVLSAALYKEADYLHTEVPQVSMVKMARWGHEGIIFRSYDIRKRHAPFGFCIDKAEEAKFRDELTSMFARSPATIIAAAINKPEHRKQYNAPENPYFLSTQFVLERIHSETVGRSVSFVFESRGPTEDAQLKKWFEAICDGQNFRSAKYPFTICFAMKKHNVTGLQIADLACNPIAAYVQDRKTSRPDWLTVQKKLRKSPGGRYLGWGLKVFP